MRSTTVIGLAAIGLLAMQADSAQGSGRYYSGAGTVTCESERGGYVECYTGYRAPPELVEQLSNSSCVQGQSWGHRQGMVWVSRGCRAVFEETSGWGGGWSGGGNANSITCESRDNRYTECRANFRGAVELSEQLSNKPCVEGRTWGQTRGGVWVDGGCRGVFSEFYQSGGNHWGQSSGYNIVCESRDSRYQRCTWDWGRGKPFLVEQYSSAPCVRGRSWGYDERRQELWVNEGCRGLFGSR